MAVLRAPRGQGRPTELYRTLSATLVGVLLLAVVGAVLGPQWDPAPLDSDLEVQTTSTAIGAAPALRSYEVRTTVVTVQLDGAQVQALLREPIGAPEGREGVVFVHGAGTGRYESAFNPQAAALARAGVVTLVPNKRLDTYSTRHRDYVAMAADYERSVDLLRQVPGVDPARVGVYAESEGGWIAPVMAVDDPAIAFVALVSTPVVPPRQQAAFATDAYLRNTQVPGGVFRAIPRAINLTLPGGGFEYADFDVAPYQQQMRQPVLVVYGTADASMPIIQGAQQVVADTAVAGNDQVTVRYYENANHGIKVDGTVVPAFLRDLAGWVTGLPATADAQPRIAGAQPEQTFAAGPVPEPTWLRDGMVMLGVLLSALGVLVLAPLLVGSERAVRALTRRDGPRFGRGVAAHLAALGAGAVATVVALAWYIITVAHLALDYERNAVAVRGGWIAVRLLGIGAVVAGVLLLRRVGVLRTQQVPVAPGLLRTAVAVLVVVAWLTLLVVLAYWGVFQLGI